MNFESQYLDVIHDFFHQRISNREDAEDQAQEVFAKVFKKESSLEEINSLQAWLLTVARNQLIDYYRKKKLSTTEIGSGTEPLTLQEESDVLNELESCLVPLIEELDTEDRQLLKAIDLKKIPQKEMAQSLNLPYATLRSQVQRARKKLRQKFVDACHLSFDSCGNLQNCERKAESPC